MRRLKYHEQKLLKRTDFMHYPKENTQQEIRVMRKYHIQKRDHYMKYRRLVSSIRRLATELQDLPSSDSFRIGMTDQLIEKLYSMGISTSKGNLEQALDLTVSSFCRRRFPVVLVNLKFVQTIKEASNLIEAGHFRIGPEVVTDPAFLVTREAEDNISWVDGSKVKRHIDEYHNKVDDYDEFN